jgi:hypothetical protein
MDNVRNPKVGFFTKKKPLALENPVFYCVAIGFARHQTIKKAEAFGLRLHKDAINFIVPPVVWPIEPYYR